MIGWGLTFPEEGLVGRIAVGTYITAAPRTKPDGPNNGPCAGEIVNENGSNKTSARAKLIQEVFLRSIDARLAFSRSLERCAIKGWPDKASDVRNTTRVQELFWSQLTARLNHLILLSGWDDAQWRQYTNTAMIQERLQDRWSEHDEQGLRLRNASYAQIYTAITELRAVSDPQALEEPLQMARRDPELIAAAWKLDNAVRALDEELAETWRADVPH